MREGRRFSSNQIKEKGEIGMKMGPGRNKGLKKGRIKENKGRGREIREEEEYKGKRANRERIK